VIRLLVNFLQQTKWCVYDVVRVNIHHKSMYASR